MSRRHRDAPSAPAEGVQPEDPRESGDDVTPEQEAPVLDAQPEHLSDEEKVPWTPHGGFFHPEGVEPAPSQSVLTNEEPPAPPFVPDPPNGPDDKATPAMLDDGEQKDDTAFPGEEYDGTRVGNPPNRISRLAKDRVLVTARTTVLNDGLPYYQGEDLWIRKDLVGRLIDRGSVEIKEES